MVSVQEIVGWRGRGGLLDVVDKDGNVVPIDRREEVTLIDGETPSNQEKKRKAGKEAVKGFFCGDCLAEIPRGSACAHMKTGKRGGRYADDNPRY